MQPAYRSLRGCVKAGARATLDDVVKHPFAVGLGVGAGAMLAVWKRHQIIAAFTHAKALSGASDEGGALPILWLLARRPRADLLPVVHAMTVEPAGLLPALSTV